MSRFDEWQTETDAELTPLRFLAAAFVFAWMLVALVAWLFIAAVAS